MDSSPETESETETCRSGASIATSHSGPERKRARMCPSWPSSSASEQSIDVEVKHHRRRKSRKLKNHKDSSKATQEELAKYLDVDTSGCPNNTHHGEELQGTTPNELVQDLLNDMQNKQFPFPVKTYEDLVQDITGSMPKWYQQRLEKHITAPLQTLLNKVDFKEGNSEELLESYKSLYSVVYRKCREVMSSNDFAARISYAVEVLKPLHLFLERVIRPNDDPFNKHLAHRYYVDFWKGLLWLTICHNHDKDNTSFDVRTKQLLHSLPVKLEARHGSDVSPVLYDTNADILCETLVLRDIDASGWPVGVEHTYEQLYRYTAYSFRTLVFEVQAQHLVIEPHAKGTAQRCTSASDNPSDIGNPGTRSVEKRQSDSVTSRKSKRSSTRSDSRKTPKTIDPAQIRTDDGESSDATPPMNPRLGPMLTQHVLELLGMMEAKDLARGQAVQAHGIGLYIVMHRVYLTGLFAVSDGRVPYYVKANHLYRRETGNKYQLKCCKYFNLFKPGHLTALMDFIQYLMFHQHKVMDLFV